MNEQIFFNLEMYLGLITFNNGDFYVVEVKKSLRM